MKTRLDFGKVLIFTSLLVSLFSVFNYGVATDAKTQREHRLVSAKAYFLNFGLLDYAPKSVQEVQDIHEYEHLHYGTALQYPLILLEYFLHPNDRLFWVSTHLYIHILFLVSAYYLYKLAKIINLSNFTSNTLLIFYILYPRIYAHSFFNIKDIVFMSVMVFCMYSLYKYQHKKKKGSLLIFSILSALAINTRIMGVLLPAYFLVCEFSSKEDGKYKNIVVYFAVTSLSLYMLWPYLWIKGFGGILSAFSIFSHYSRWNYKMVFNGSLISGSDVPFYYAPYWILITSPYIYLIIWVLGFYSYIKHKNQFMFPLFIVLASLLSVVVFDSILYSGWRHLYYIYPNLMIMGSFGIETIYKKYYRYKRYITIFVILNVLALVFWLTSNYPNQQVYFNKFAGDWEQKWDRDYWRLSGLQALRLIAEDNDKQAFVLNSTSTSLNYYMLSEQEKNKIVLLTDENKVNYIVADYYGIMGRYPDGYFSGFVRYDDITVGGRPIMTIYAKKQ